VKRDAQAVLLLLLGGTLIKISVNGTYVRYVKVGLRPLLLVAGVVLVVIAAVTLWQMLRPSAEAGDERIDVAANAAGEPADIPVDEANGHAHDQLRVGWLLLAPALALLLFAPPAIGAFQAGRSGTALSAAADSDFSPLPAGDPVRLSVLDYASRAVFDQGRSLAKRRVKLTGFVIPGPGGQPYLARMMVTCCAADARPIKVGLTGLIPADLAENQWIEVVGAYTGRSDRDPVNGDVIPYLQVSSTREIAAPEQQYES
jgi:uncharacterized repeat protein (TIGR03943 family)